MATARSLELQRLAQRIADALPPVAEEAVLTGSVSRGAADEVSDIEMLIVTAEQLDLETCFEHAGRIGLESLDTWGAQGTPASRVFGYLEGVPIELIWWPREFAEAAVARLVEGEESSSADAIVNGVPLRTVGLLARWQEDLADYPEAIAAARIESAALTWGGYAPEGLFTVARPGERLSCVERLLDDALRVLKIVYALNRAWEPTTKRVAARVDELALKPDRLAERIEEALTEPDLLRALLVMNELQLETVMLAPSGPNVDRARRWLSEAVRVLQAAASASSSSAP
jgi:predicted nucleotidyltransferase